MYLPASTPPDRTIRVAVVPRGGNGQVEHLNIPNWASSTNHSSIQLRDFVQPCSNQRKHGKHGASGCPPGHH